MDFEKYKPYIDSPIYPIESKYYAKRLLKAAGWNELLNEVFSPLMQKELGMKYLGNRIWADDYCNHRRRILSLFQPNDIYGSFKWGWNYDFVPKISGSKTVYARTDKSIFPHFYENIHCNHDVNVYESYTESDFIFDRWLDDINDFQYSMNKKVNEYIKIFYMTLPLIQAFYSKTDTYESTIKMIDALMEHGYYRFIQGINLHIAKVFIQQYIKNDDNQQALIGLFKNDAINKSLLQKFEKIPSDHNNTI